MSNESSYKTQILQFYQIYDIFAKKYRTVNFDFEFKFSLVKSVNLLYSVIYFDVDRVVLENKITA
jgi:hypothetical protein